MIEGLRRNGVEVTECHEPLWQGVEDRVRAASGGWMNPSFIMRVLRTYSRLVRKHREVGDYDVMVLGYPGQLDVPLARLLAWSRRRPLVLDVFMSIYLIAQERGLTDRCRATAALMYGLERLACRLADLLILDTEEYMAWFQTVYHIDPSCFRLVPTGADDRIFQPLAPRERDDDFFRVLYYGTFIPNHGVEYIIEAARLLRDKPQIRFELVGEGPDKGRVEALAEAYGLTNVMFTGWMAQEQLLAKIAEADVCLGAFGTTPQSLMTVQNKIYEGLAAAKPVITGDSPTIRRQMRHGEHLYLCERANPASLAEAIRTLEADPALCSRLAERGHRLYLDQYDLRHNGVRFRAHLQELVDSGSKEEVS